MQNDNIKLMETITTIFGRRPEIGVYNAIDIVTTTGEEIVAAKELTHLSKFHVYQIFDYLTELKKKSNQRRCSRL